MKHMVHGLTLAPGVLDAMRAQLVSAGASGRPQLAEAERALVSVHLDKMAAGGPVPQGMAAVVDVYRDDFLADMNDRCERWGGKPFRMRERSSPAVPNADLSPLARTFAASAYYPASMQLAWDEGILNRMDIVPTPIVASDVRPTVNPALGISPFEVADGALIVGFLCFVQEAYGWTAPLHAIPSPIDEYTAFFANRAHPVVVGPGFQEVHGTPAPPFAAAYHDLFHIVLLCEKYPSTEAGRAAHATSVRAHETVVAFMREQGLEDLPVWFGGNMHTVRSRLCEGLRLDGTTVDRSCSQDVSDAVAKEILDLAQQLTG